MEQQDEEEEQLSEEGSREWEPIHYLHHPPPLLHSSSNTLHRSLSDSQTQFREWSMVAFRDAHFDSNHDHSIVFPPINHEGLHITSSPSDDQHQDLKPSNSPPDDNGLVPLSPPQTAGVGGEAVARWVGFGFELLRSKVSGIASSVRNFVGFGGTNWSYSLGANRSFSSTIGVAAALLVWCLLVAVRQRRRRVLVRKESRDHLILLIKEKDEVSFALQVFVKMSSLVKCCKHLYMGTMQWETGK
ncbi:hypothetical protein CsSME_00053667 [Camellia sinensis var. sinensis]